MKRKSKLPPNERRSVIKARAQAEAALLPKTTVRTSTTELVRQWRFEKVHGTGIVSELRKRQVIR